MYKSIVKILWIILLSKFINCGFNYTALNESPPDSLDKWFNQLNYQYKILSHYSELYKWDIYVNLQEKFQNDYNELIENWSNWKRRKCFEAKNYLDQMTINEERMTFMLCRGPNYSNTESKEVVLVNKKNGNLQKMEICLQKDFDICTNALKIWEFTFMRSKGQLLPFNYSEKERQISPANKELFTKPLICLSIEHDIKSDIFAKNLFAKKDNCKFTDDLILKWTWESSRLALSSHIDLAKVVNVMNVGANRNGYHDIGECWREQLETHGLTEIANQLWSKIKPFYQLLHGILRNALQKKYSGRRIIPKNGPIPAYLLGSAGKISNWENYLDLLLPFRKVNLDENFIKKNWTNLDMVKRSEDFYASLGMSRMTGSFWKNSNFSNTNNGHSCSASYANMFDGNDYRLNLCTDQSLNGFYKIVNQMGYIEYAMLFSDQPALFQNPPNTAFGDAIGNAIFLGSITPQHLNRLRLLPDKFLYPNNIPGRIHNTKLSYDFGLLPKNKIHSENNSKFDDLSVQIYQIDSYKKSTLLSEMGIPLNDFDITLLLKLALNKIPKISFEYIMDRIRWDLLSNKVNLTNVNDYFWQLVHQEQGVFPLKNHFNFIDHTAEYHVLNNIPYVSYFLSSFLEVQIFKGLCEYTIFGEFYNDRKIPMPLHRCDIYGSKRAGRLLKKAMSLGSSVHWSEVLFILTGKTEISPLPLLEYYEPLIIWLEKYTNKDDISLGW